MQPFTKMCGEKAGEWGGWGGGVRAWEIYHFILQRALSVCVCMRVWLVNYYAPIVHTYHSTYTSDTRSYIYSRETPTIHIYHPTYTFTPAYVHVAVPVHVAGEWEYADKEFAKL